MSTTTCREAQANSRDTSAKWDISIRRTDVEVVRDGVEALEFLFCEGQYEQRSPNSQPNVILLDLKLPRIDGLEVLKRIKSDPRTRYIPVVVLTSSNQQRDIIESYKLGVNSYITKPVNFEQFTEAIYQIGLYWVRLNQPPIS